MPGSIKAVIFDMDGVLIDSEPLWRQAMIKGFKEFGMVLTEDDCSKTTGSRIGEVIELWLAHFNLTEISSRDVEKRIIEMLLALIEEKGAVISGIPALLDFCKEKGLKLGVATSSSVLLMDTVLTKLSLTNMFDAALSAEYLRYAKPHPQVFINCAQKLNIPPQHCLVIEDSLNGVIAGKAAKMKVIAVPDEKHLTLKGFAVADYQLRNMHEVLALCKTFVF